MSVYVGLMSGTSLDGISAAVVRFTPKGEGAGPSLPVVVQSEAEDPHFHAELLAFHVHEYSPAQRERLLAAMSGATAQEYCRLAVDFGGWLADAAVAVLAEAGVARADVRAVGSHGQTLWHEPGHSTWQLDAPAVIAERTGIAVVSDFRVRDVAAGGQGAPLVPIADALLFGGGKWRALQNIGGIGNVTVVPPDGTLASVRAFDTGPGVGVLDAVVRSLDASKRYDKDGRIAAQGIVLSAVVDELLQAPYFAAEPPKSTGRELFDAAYVARFIARCKSATDNDADVVATATALTAASIADAYRRFIPEPIEEVLVSGGGAKNPVLMQMLSAAVAPLPVVPFDARYFDGEAKEAVAFALLAHLHLEDIPGNVPTATGARGRRVLGLLTPA
jgi:anhydro-N-acetylmuramic acid kinase